MNTWFYLALFLLFSNLVSMFVMYIRMKARFSEKRILSDIRSEIDKLIMDLGRETDRSVAILENRIRATQDLMEKADKRILLADRETKKRMTQPEIPLQTRAQEPENIHIPEQEKPVTIYTRPMITRSEKQLEPEIPLRERVVEMARKDISPQMIATTLSVSLGEIELILNMNNSSL